MKRLSELLPRLTPGQFLAIIVLALVILSCANLLFSTLRYEFGLGYVSPITGPSATGLDDRFADLVKMSLSYRPFVSSIKTSTLSSWPDIFRRYYLVPSYGGKEALASGKKVTHFHVPPLMTLQFLASASLINYTQSAALDLVVFFGLYLATVQCTLMIGVPAGLRGWKVQLAAWCYALISYPALMVFCRGNFQGGYACLFIIAFLLSFYVRNRVEPFGLLALAIAVNFRPNAVIFVLALPLALGWKKSLRPLITFSVMAAGICIASYLVVNRLYPDYTWSAFRRGLDIYNHLYVFGGHGDAGNASLWAFAKNYISFQTRTGSNVLVGAIVLGIVVAVRLWRLRRPLQLTVVPVAAILLYAGVEAVTPDYRLAIPAFAVLAFCLAASAAWALWRCPNRGIVVPFVLAAFYCLFSPVFAEYHLMVFLGPLLLVYFKFHDWAQNYRAMAAITAACVLVMSPKNYLYIGALSVQTVLNPLILYLACAFALSEASLTRGAGTWPAMTTGTAPAREAAKA